MVSQQTGEVIGAIAGTMAYGDKVALTQNSASLCHPNPKSEPAIRESFLFYRVWIPSTLFGAAAICWYDPSKAPALFFALCAFGFLYADTIINASKRDTVRHISDGITLSMVEFSKDTEQSSTFIAALTETIHVILAHDQLTSTFKQIVVDSMRDEQLQSELLDTLSGAIVRASADDNLRKVLLSAFQQGFEEALNDQDFMDAMLRSMVHAIVSASQNKALLDAMLDVTTEAVSASVRDARFMQELKEAMKDCLRDSDIFRAGASGFFGALNPRRATQQQQQQDPSS